MSTNLPSQKLPSIEWLEGHIVNWNANAAGIGLASAAVISLGTDIANARQAFTVTTEIRTESKSKTADYYAKTKLMHDNAAILIQAIKAFADAAETPSAVYTLAQISAPDPASPSAPPSQPVIDDYRVLGDGSVKIEWEAIGPGGTIYNVTRKVAGETAFTFVGQGDSSDKSFIDTTLPAGSATASYRVQGVRGPLTGLVSAMFTVSFGVGQDGEEAAAA